MFETIIYEAKDGIATIYLNRPNKLNSLSSRTCAELLEAINKAAEDKIKVLVIRANGKAFCAGADLEEVKPIMDKPPLAKEFIDQVNRLFFALEEAPFPVIAAVHGVALAGGLEMVMACDLAIVTESCRLGDQHANFGLIPGGGGTQKLPRLVGMRRAKYLVLTGAWLSAQQALEMGLVNMVVPDNELDKAVQELASNLASKSPLVNRTVKKLMRQGIDLDIKAAMELEILSIVQHFSSEDVHRGIEAFEQKTKPVFVGK